MTTPNDNPITTPPMTPHIGTKHVNATPMTLGNYNIYRGWELPEDEEPSTEGFMVEYLGSTDSNHKSHSGYISWTPAEQFNNHYDDLSSGISYGHALLLLELGYKLAREGWNGKGMFIVYMSVKY